MSYVYLLGVLYFNEFLKPLKSRFNVIVGLDIEMFFNFCFFHKTTKEFLVSVCETLCGTRREGGRGVKLHIQMEFEISSIDLYTGVVSV